MIKLVVAFITLIVAVYVIANWNWAHGLQGSNVQLQPAIMEQGSSSNLQGSVYSLQGGSYCLQNCNE